MDKGGFINPHNKEAYYSLGVIAWVKWLVPDREARTRMDMRPEDPGPLPDWRIRDRLKAEYRPVLDDGIANMKKALEIDPAFYDAMAYMNLLIRYRADLDDLKNTGGTSMGGCMGAKNFRSKTIEG